MNDDVRQVVADLLESAPARPPGGSWSEAAERPVFDRLLAEGWTRVGLAESLGGSGGDMRDAASVVSACAASEHLLPVAEVVISAARVLEMAQLELPPDVDCVIPLMTPGSCDEDGRVHVRAQRVPWGRWATHFLVLTSSRGQARVCLIDAKAAEVAPGRNLADEPRDDVTVAGVSPTAVAGVERPLVEVLAQLRLAGALARSVQMAAAIECVLRLSTRYCADRRQFGKRLRDFQAVQQELAALTGESAAATGAVTHALDHLRAAPSDLSMAPIATAKVRTGMAAGSAARSGHQLHGAIGITLEYPLHQFTTRLWSWRDEYGTEYEWASLLHAQVAAEAASSPWEWLAPIRHGAELGA
jgi:acyl-CoA dehydrogenase